MIFGEHSALKLTSNFLFYEAKLIKNFINWLWILDFFISIWCLHSCLRSVGFHLPCCPSSKSFSILLFSLFLSPPAVPWKPFLLLLLVPSMSEYMSNSGFLSIFMPFKSFQTFKFCWAPLPFVAYFIQPHCCFHPSSNLNAIANPYVSELKHSTLKKIHQSLHQVPFYFLHKISFLFIEYYPSLWLLYF